MKRLNYLIAAFAVLLVLVLAIIAFQSFPIIGNIKEIPDDLYNKTNTQCGWCQSSEDIPYKRSSKCGGMNFISVEPIIPGIYHICINGIGPRSCGIVSEGKSYVTDLNYYFRIQNNKLEWFRVDSGCVGNI